MLFRSDPVKQTSDWQQYHLLYSGEKAHACLGALHEKGKSGHDPFNEKKGVFRLMATMKAAVTRGRDPG